MKLRSIALASLLGAGLLMSTGCTEDDVKDAVNDLVKPNAVYVVNAHGTDAITAHADSESKPVANGDMEIFALAGQGNTDVYYTVGSNDSEHTSLAYGNAHLYVASDICNVGTNGFGKITDVSSGQGIVKLVNATNAALTADSTNTVTVHVTNNGTTDDIDLVLESGTTVASCAKATSTTKISDLGIVQGSVISVTIGSTTSDPYTVEDNVPTTVDVDIVYLGNENAVAVPLVKWDDLLNN